MEGPAPALSLRRRWAGRCFGTNAAVNPCPECSTLSSAGGEGCIRVWRVFGALLYLLHHTRPRRRQGGSAGRPYCVQFSVCGDSSLLPDYIRVEGYLVSSSFQGSGQRDIPESLNLDSCYDILRELHCCFRRFVRREAGYCVG